VDGAVSVTSWSGARVAAGMVVLVPPHLLEKSPSLTDGMDAETEERLRTYGGELIQRAGVLLRMPQMTVASAAAIFQRFYFCKSFADFEVRAVACAAVVLASKLEENIRRLHQVVVVFYRLEMREQEEDDGKSTFARQPTPFLDISGKDFEGRKTQVVRAERYILRELGFEVSMFLDLPHHYVLRYAEAMTGKRRSALSQKAWSHVTDALRTRLCCTNQPDVIAAAGVFLAARSLGIKLPRSPPWWVAFEVDLAEVRHVAAVIMGLYRRPKVFHIAIPRKKKAAPVVPDVPATPLAETPAPMASPDADSDAPDENWQKVEPGEGSDGDGTPRAAIPAVNGHASVVQGSAPPGNGLDAGRIEELVEEGRSAGREALEPSKGVDDPKEARKDKDLERERERDNKDKEQEKDPSDRRKEKDREREREDRGKKRDREQEKRDREPERRRDKEKEELKERGREKTREKQRKGRDRCSSSSSASARSSSPKKGKRKPQQPSKAKDRKARREASSSSAASSERKKPRRRNTGRSGVDDEDL